MNQSASEQRLGLALSGGGFRAVLYHLGVIRFLRDAGILPRITHITSVSGGSVIGAHLVLNWDRYSGSDDDFQQVSGELLRFLQMDVRNRIVRRFPLASVLNAGLRMARIDPLRQLTRAGLLEQHYQRFLYGDTALFRLPESPRLYILATNLSEGSLCAFHRDGLLLQRRSRCGTQVRLEEVEMGLATVPMAVAASSAFPGFFPPLELRGKDVGSRSGEFDRHAFTDGGIYDNLGLRMFRYLQESDALAADPVESIEAEQAQALSERASAVVRDLEAALLHIPSRTARLRSDSPSPPPDAHWNDHHRQLLAGTCLAGKLHLIPAFSSLASPSSDAQTQQARAAAGGYRPDQAGPIPPDCEHPSTPTRQLPGHSRSHTHPAQLDGVLVSDAGATFKVRSEGRAGGLLSTALRSTDIIMDRVNQMELEAFADTPGVLFFPIRRVVGQADDPSAPRPEIQQLAAQIRTDMDRFSNLEITSLVQHGYCVARQVFRENAASPHEAIPAAPPWNPLEASRKRSESKVVDLNDASQALHSARLLQRSSSRKTLSTLLDLRDWPTYVWLPLFFLAVFTLPWNFYLSRQLAIQQEYVLAAVADTSPIYHDVLSLLRKGPMADIPAVEFEEVSTVEPLDFTGYELISDDRIYDLRGWTGEINPESQARMHARLRIKRTQQAMDRPQLRIQLPSTQPSMNVEYRPTSIGRTHRRAKIDPNLYLFETTLDFSHLPVGSDTTLIVNQIVPEFMAQEKHGVGRFKFTVAANTGLLRVWILMPEGRKHDQFELYRFPMDAPGEVERVEATSTVELPIGSVVAFDLINPSNNSRYECRWRWLDKHADH